MCFALGVGGRVRKNRAVVSSGASNYRRFGISTTATTVAVVLCAVDANGTAIIIGVAEWVGNVHSPPEGSNTAALVGGNSKLM